MVHLHNIARNDAHSKRENHQKNFAAFFSDIKLAVRYYEAKITHTIAIDALMSRFFFFFLYDR